MNPWGSFKVACALAVLGMCPGVAAQSVAVPDARAPVAVAVQTDGTVWAVLSPLTAAPGGTDPALQFRVTPDHHGVLELPLGDSPLGRQMAGARGTHATAVDAQGHHCTGSLDAPTYVGVYSDPAEVYPDGAPVTADATWFVGARVRGCRTGRLHGDLLAVALGAHGTVHPWLHTHEEGPAVADLWHTLPAYRATVARLPRQPYGVPAGFGQASTEVFTAPAGDTLRMLSGTVQAGDTPATGTVWLSGGAVLRGEGGDIALVMDLGDPAYPVVLQTDPQGQAHLCRRTGNALIEVARAAIILRVEPGGCG